MSKLKFIGQGMTSNIKLDDRNPQINVLLGAELSVESIGRMTPKISGVDSIEVTNNHCLIVEENVVPLKELQILGSSSVKFFNKYTGDQQLNIIVGENSEFIQQATSDFTWGYLYRGDDLKISSLTLMEGAKATFTHKDKEYSIINNQKINIETKDLHPTVENLESLSKIVSNLSTDIENLIDPISNIHNLKRYEEVNEQYKGFLNTDEDFVNNLIEQNEMNVNGKAIDQFIKDNFLTVTGIVKDSLEGSAFENQSPETLSNIFSFLRIEDVPYFDTEVVGITTTVEQEMIN